MPAGLSFPGLSNWPGFSSDPTGTTALSLLGMLYFSIPLLLSYFPITAPFASTIMPYVTGPAKQFAAAIVGCLPRLVTLILIVIAIRYLLRLIQFIATALEKEEIPLLGFEPDWADPTYKLVRSLILLLGLMKNQPVPCFPKQLMREASSTGTSNPPTSC